MKLIKKTFQALIIFLFLSLEISFGEESPIYIGEEQVGFEQSILVINQEDNPGNIKLQFGGNLNKYLLWDDGNSYFLFSHDLNLSGNQIINYRMENVDGLVTGHPECSANFLGREFYDISDYNAYVCIETAPEIYSWFNLMATIEETATKVVTVGTNADYSSIGSAAGYLNTLTGGIMLLTPETHVVNFPVNLEFITLIGANPDHTIIYVNNNGSMQVKDSQFKSLSINIDQNLVDQSGLDVQYNPTMTSSLVFEWVNFEIGNGKLLINSKESTAPNLISRFVSSSASGDLVDNKASANLNPISKFFISSQGGSGALNFNDWDVNVSGSANVSTTGTITTIPNDTIYVYPGMNIQGAINSLPNGGFMTFLPGIHNINEPIIINNNSIEMIGYGDASIIRASGFADTSDTIAAIQIGSADGTNPVNGVVIKDLKVEVSGSNIHGVRASGGEDIQLYNLTVQKISGAGGTGDTARIGIQFLDGVNDNLVRPVIKNCRVFGNGTGNYFTDGIHLTGGSDYGYQGIWMNGQKIINALVEGNNIDYVRETVAVFIGVDDSSLFNNRFSRMGAGGSTSYGLFLGNSNRVNMASNVISRSLSSGSYGFVVDNIDTGSLKEVADSIITSTTIDGTADGGIGFLYAFVIGSTNNTNISRNIFQSNIVRGASNLTTSAFYIQGEVDDNLFTSNTIVGGTNSWNTGFNILNSTTDRNFIRGNKFINVNNNLADNGTGTTREAAVHTTNSAPTVNDDIDAGYDLGTIWINTSNYTIYVNTNNSSSTAVWNELGGGTGGPVASVIGQFYDSTGGLDINQATPISIPWDAETRKDTGIIHDNSVDNSRIILETVGWYRVSYNISYEDTDNSRRNIKCQARVNGSTFIIPSASYTYARNTSDKYATNSTTFIFETNLDNDYLEILCSQAGSAGTAPSVANDSWVLLEGIN